MQVNITFRNMFATDALRNHVQERLAKVADKYLDKVTEAHVTLSLERYLHHADINLQSGQFHVRGKEKSEDMYASIDKVSDKLEAQIRSSKDQKKGQERASDHLIPDLAALGDVGYFDRIELLQSPEGPPAPKKNGGAK